MAVTQSFTGRQGQLTVAGNFLPITGHSGKITRNYADSTDSNTYDPTTGQVWETQAPGTAVAEGAAKGNYDLTTTSLDILALFLADGPYSAIFGVTRAKNLMSGTFNFQNFNWTIEVGGAVMCSWTSDFKSHGIITLY